MPCRNFFRLTKLRQISTHQCFSERRWYRIATASNLLILCVLLNAIALNNDIQLRNIQPHTKIFGTQHQLTPTHSKKLLHSLSK